MYSSIYLFLILAALPSYIVIGTNVAPSLSRRLRTSNSAEQVQTDTISSFVEDDFEVIEEIESHERLRSMRELLRAAVAESFMSFNPTESPTSQPTCVHTSEAPSVPPTALPSVEPTASPSSAPTATPSTAPTATHSTAPTATPSTAPTATPSTAPAESPSATPTISPSAVPSDSKSDAPSTSPSDTPSDSPSDTPSDSPSDSPSDTPSVSPSMFPSALPSTVPSAAAIITPIVTPVPVPVLAPVAISPVPVLVTIAPMAPPTLPPLPSKCPGITDDQRVLQILAILDAVADPDDIRNNSMPQGLATTWIIAEDQFNSCPDYPKLVQRWTLAVMYFSTNGDGWFQCSANPNAVDLCGIQSPFESEERFLSALPECEWAGIQCIEGCVTEIEFEQNNLIGTIPTEMGLLSMLTIWGMERGGLSSTIPTEIGKLTNLIFIDFDFNELSGSLPSELLTLSSLTQLDLNDNLLTGSINGIGVFPNMTFLQLHGNAFTGTVPDGVGTFSNLGAFTLHESYISGTMPESVCNLRPPAGFGGKLTSLIADCSEPNPNIICDCCSDCRRATVVV